MRAFGPLLQKHAMDNGLPNRFVTARQWAWKKIAIL